MRGADNSQLLDRKSLRVLISYATACVCLSTHPDSDQVLLVLLAAAELEQGLGQMNSYHIHQQTNKKGAKVGRKSRKRCEDERRLVIQASHGQDRVRKEKKRQDKTRKNKTEKRQMKQEKTETKQIQDKTR